MKRSAIVLLSIVLLIAGWPLPAVHAKADEPDVTGTYYWEKQVQKAGANWPIGRTAPLMAYHEEEGYVLMFGGWTQATRLNDTWIWKDGEWTQISTPPSGTPAIRSGGGMVYDPERKEIIMFGGDGAGDLKQGDTWRWKTLEEKWVKLSPAQSPPARGVPQMAYDPIRKNIVLFGGVNASNIILGDTWIWNGTTWSQITGLSTSPPARSFGQMAFDGTQIVLFGGIRSGSSKYNDTWLWNGSSWTEKSVVGSKPSARHGGAFAYDPDYKKVILYGGSSTKEENDAWVWDGEAYERFYPNVTVSARNDATMVYDNGKKQFVMFGGFLGGAPKNETWTMTILPSLSLATGTTITETTAQLQADIIDQANSPVTERGFLYSSTSVDPRIGESNAIQVSSGSGLGQFTADISGLTPGTMYYLRPYAKNAQGTAYGNVTNFTTASFTGALTSIGLVDEVLNEPFDAERLAYSVNVLHHVEAVTLNPTAADHEAIVVWNGNELTAGESAQVALDVGINTLQITTKSKDRVLNGRVYIVTIERAPAAPIGVEAIAGDTEAVIDWAAENGASEYRIYQSTTAGSYGAPVATVGGSVYRYTATGLVNGTPYFFTVKSVYEGVVSAASPEVSVVPQVVPPGAPAISSVLAGDGQVVLNWTEISDSTAYKIYRSTVSGSYDEPIDTVSASVYSYKSDGLINGTTYYFIVKSTNPGGDSVASAEVSAMPYTVPDAPTGVTATAGNGQASVSFIPPVGQGGGTVTDYLVTAYPGAITAVGTESPITITGLINGTTYTFTVRAINEAGEGSESAVSAPVTPQQPIVHIPPPPPIMPDKQEIFVNDKPVSGGTRIEKIENGRKTITFVVDEEKLSQILADEQSGAVIVLPVMTSADTIAGELTGSMIRSLEQQQAVVQVRSAHALYSLPAGLVDMDAIAAKLGSQVNEADIRISIEIAQPTAEQTDQLMQAALSAGYEIVAPMLDFTVKAIYGDVVMMQSSFDAYVERAIALPEGIDPRKITTGVAMEADGSMRHVPTKVDVIDGTFYAIINSLTNSTYAVIWNPLEFEDVAQHWSKAQVNDMGSRTVIGGFDERTFKPDQAITRAEFAVIIVRALGLKQDKGHAPFTDVNSSEWHHDAVYTAYVHHLIDGFDDGSFQPDASISREQALVIISRAMKMTRLHSDISAEAAQQLLRSFADAEAVSPWAADNVAEAIAAGIIQGREDQELAPKSSITRAEVAVIVQRLLSKSKLI